VPQLREGDLMSEIREVALTESRTLRDQYAGRTDVLDKVKALSLLPDGVHATTEMVASYYEVDVDAVESLVQRNRAELELNGRRVLRGSELREFKQTVNLTGSSRNALALFTRRTILNVGQLLTESSIAQAVRTYLLDVEEVAGPEVRNEAIERAAVSRAQVKLLDAARNLVDPGWLGAKTKVVIARGLGEEPEIDPDDMPLYVPDFLKSKGLAKADIESVQSWFGRRVASLYEAEHGEKPGKRASELPNGQIRETYAWTRRDMPLFGEAWDRWYADRYPATLALIDGGA
jgi:hypothetical protein